MSEQLIFFFLKIWYLAENKREKIAFPKYQLLGELINHTFFIDYRLIVISRYFCFKNNPTKAGLHKLVYRLIVLFLSTEIFSKRRKIYAWFDVNHHDQDSSIRSTASKLWFKWTKRKTLKSKTRELPNAIKHWVFDYKPIFNRKHRGKFFLFILIVF